MGGYGKCGDGDGVEPFTLKDRQHLLALDSHCFLSSFFYYWLFVIFLVSIISLDSQFQHVSNGINNIKMCTCGAPSGSPELKKMICDYYFLNKDISVNNSNRYLKFGLLRFLI